MIAIGVGAGGLDALVEILSNFDACGSSLVVVSQPPPSFDALAAAVRSATRLEVVEVTSGAPILPDRVYLAPSDADCALFHGTFHVLAPIAAKRTPRLAIDFFMRSLAAEAGTSAIGVLLEGHGVDGAYGIEAIRAEGGVTIRQEPSAEGSGAPPALRLGDSDLVLPPKRLAGELLKLSAHPYVATPRGRRGLRPARGRREHGQDLSALFVLIRSAFGTDLTFYKPTTIERRIERRMVVHRIERLADYVSFVKEHPGEIEIIYRDCLIGVTGFFRDEEPFEVLKTTVLPRIVENKRPGPIRVWVPGCSTGEEAYSIAICLLEALDSRPNERLQIFASDLDGDAIRRARRGLYPPNIVQDVSPARLERFFTLQDGQYQVAHRVRDLVVFAEQDVTRDAPYSHVDLVSCRNLLIYLEAPVQKRILRLFHYALKPDGALLLGSSETIGDSADLFAIGDQHAKIYFKRNTPAPVFPELSLGTTAAEAPSPTPTEARPLASLQQVADRKVLEKYGPPGVLVNENLDVLHFRGRVGAYLEPTAGVASLNLLKLIRPELMVELRATLRRAQLDNVSASARTMRLRDGEESRAVELEVIPIQDSETRSRCFLVLFRDVSPDVHAPAAAAPTDVEGSRIADLERELQATKDYLQSTVEDLESANEELKAANEELQSSNEELQSTNEEIETSKEELQSTNEELTTVNDELQTRMRELSVANDDLLNFLATTRDAIIIVGTDLRIRRFTRAAARLLQLADTDRGRPIGFLGAFVDGLDVESLIVDAIDRMADRTEEVLGADKRWYAVRAAPYKTAERAIRGAVLSFADIHADRRRSELAQRINRHAVNVLSALRGALVLLDADQRVLWANHRYHELFQSSDRETIGNLFHNLGNGPWAHPKLRALLACTVAEGTPFTGFSIAHDFERIGGRTVQLSASRIVDEANAPLVLLLIEEEEVDGERGKSS